MIKLFSTIYTEIINNINQYFDSSIPIQICSTDGRQTAISANANVLEFDRTICDCLTTKFRIDVFYQSAMHTNIEKIECLDNMLELLYFLVNNLKAKFGSCSVESYPTFVTKNSNGLDICEISLNISVMVTPNGN